MVAYFKVRSKFCKATWIGWLAYGAVQHSNIIPTFRINTLQYQFNPEDKDRMFFLKFGVQPRLHGAETRTTTEGILLESFMQQNS
jgi:hypothetical protein